MLLHALKTSPGSDRLSPFPDLGAPILAELPIIAQSVADNARGHEDATLLTGPGQAKLHAGVGDMVGGAISGPTRAEISSSEGGWDLNARGGDVASVFAGCWVAGWARITGFE
ncbi:hypothetical protein MMC07_004876 [Pseudocyphellaria aurata]|nr:hypothetical protein [Pseudocyphellaria aurata]